MVTKQKGIIVLLFLAVMLIPLVSSAPSKFSGTSSFGIDIEHPLVTTLKVNETHKFHFHIFNASTGIPIKADGKTANCTFHLYNSSGSHIVKVNDVVSSDDIYDYEQIITGGNFSKVGEYSYVFQCNSSYAGGYYTNNFQVTYLGEELTLSRSILNMGFLALLVLLFIANLIWFFSIETENKRGVDGLIVDVNNLKYLKGVLFAVGYALLIAVFFIAYNLALAFLSTKIFSSILFVIYKILFIMALPVVVVWFIWLFVSIFQDREFKSMIERGVQFGGKNDI